MPQRKKLGVTTLEDINTLILQSHDLNETLRNIVALIQRRMRTEVCSIYLLDSDSETLRLRASKGLARRSIGRVVMKIGEGLTGMVVQEGRAVTIQDPENDPRFIYFKETGEEKYHSFLGIPLFERRKSLGVIVLQTKETREFSSSEISTLTAIALQISSVVVNARLLDRINQQKEEADRVARELAAARQVLADTQGNSQEASSLAMRGHVAYPGVASGLANIMEERLGFADILDEKDIDPVE